MHPHRFDALTRSLVERGTRRRLLHHATGVAMALAAARAHWRAEAATCPSGYHPCGGDGECCDFFDGVCCGEGDRICCGPNDICFNPGDGQVSFCQAKCGPNQFRCGNGAGNCCDYFGGVCCGADLGICCNPGDICDRQTGDVPTCATPCDLFSRRCATSGECCPYGQTCCGEVCCRVGERCPFNECLPARTRRRRRKHRRRRH